MLLVVLGAAGLVGRRRVHEGAVGPAAGGQVVVDGAQVAEHLRRGRRPTGRRRRWGSARMWRRGCRATPASGRRRGARSRRWRTTPGCGPGGSRVTRCWRAVLAMRQSMSYAALVSAGTPNLVQKHQSSPKAERIEDRGGQGEVPDGQRDGHDGRVQPAGRQGHGAGVGARRCAGGHVDLHPDRLVLARGHRERGGREPAAEGLAGLGVLERDEGVRPPARRVVGRPGSTGRPGRSGPGRG